MKKIKLINYVLIIFSVILVIAATIFLNHALAQTAQVAQPVSGGGAQAAPMSPIALSVGYFSAALAVGMACIGSAKAVSNVGTAAMGAMSEKPELAGRALIFVGLAEGIAIYGLIVAIMILGKLT